MNTDFNEWFNQLEGFHIKSERFYESLTAFSNEALAINMVKWLEAAFEAGRVAEKEACAKVCDDLDAQEWAEVGEYRSGYGDKIRERTNL
jgi:hypothetical protein